MASLALAPTTSCVWRSVPDLTSPPLCGAGTSLRALRGQTRDTESDERTEQQASLSALHGALLPGRHASGGLLIEAVGAELRRAAGAVGWDGSGAPPLQLWEELGGGSGAVLDAVARGKVEASLAQSLEGEAVLL